MVAQSNSGRELKSHKIPNDTSSSLNENIK